jgi:hypothetical protein
VTRDFGSGGPFTLAAQTQAGIRVYVDGVRRIDLWRNVSTTQTKSVNVTIPPGRHTLRVDYVNFTGSANVKFGYVPRTSATVDTVKPLGPTGATASYSSSTLKATLKWARNKEMDLAGYRVYRRPAGSSAWTHIATTGATSHTDSPPATGQTYLYEVRAVDKAGNASTGSADRAVTTVDRTPPARVVPHLVMGTDRTRESYVVSWKPVADAARYRLWRRIGSDPWTSVASTTGTSLTDYVPAVGAAVFYRVAVHDTAGNVAPARTGDEGYANAYWEPRATDVTASYIGNNKALLQWTQPTDTFAISWAAYRLLRSTLAPTIEHTTSPEYCSRLSYAEEGGNFRFSCTATVTPGKTNYFAVEPYHSDTHRALPSTPVAVAVPAAPAPATDFTGVADGRRVDFTWTASPSADVDHYELRRGVWHPANSPEEQGWFYTYERIDVPADTTSLRWPGSLYEAEDFVLIAVAKDGTKLTAAQSPLVRMPAPTAE